MYPFQRFTERAKKVLTFAQEEAQAAGHGYIGTEHVLLALLREERGLAGIVLSTLGVELQGAREAVRVLLGEARTIGVSQIVPTAHVKKVIEIAFEEAQRMGHRYVGTEHLLLGLLVEGHGVAARVLADKGVTLEKARTEVGRILEAGAPEPPQTRSAAGPGPEQLLMLPDLQDLLRRAQALAAGGGLALIGLDHLLQAMVSTSAGTEALARLLDARRIAALAEQALAAQDFETAEGHRATEKQAREALEQALAAWRKELEPPRGV